MALRTLHYHFRDRLRPIIIGFTESHITNKLGRHHARRFTHSAYGTLRYCPEAPPQTHTQSPRNEEEVTQVCPRFNFLGNDLTVLLLDQIDQLFHSIGRSAFQHLRRWMEDLAQPNTHADLTQHPSVPLPLHAHPNDTRSPTIPISPVYDHTPTSPNSPPTDTTTIPSDPHFPTLNDDYLILPPPTTTLDPTPLGLITQTPLKPRTPANPKPAPPLRQIAPLNLITPTSTNQLLPTGASLISTAIPPHNPAESATRYGRELLEYMVF